MKALAKVKVHAKARSRKEGEGARKGEDARKGAEAQKIRRFIRRDCRVGSRTVLFNNVHKLSHSS